MKKVYKCECEFDVEYYIPKFPFKKQLWKETVKFEIHRIILANDIDEALKEFKTFDKIKDDKISKEDWPYVWEINNIPEHKITNKKIIAVEIEAKIQTLKERMWAKDFLAYCRQELYGIEHMLFN